MPPGTNQCCRLVRSIAWLALVIFHAVAGEFHATDAVSLNPLRLTTDLSWIRGGPSIATLSNTTILTWLTDSRFFTNHDRFGTNVYYSQIAAAGSLVSPTGVFMARIGYQAGPMKLFPAEDGFFGVFAASATYRYPQPLMTARFDRDGRLLSKPVGYWTNLDMVAGYSGPPAASNGKTILALLPDVLPNYALLNADGSVRKFSPMVQAPALPDVVLSTVANDYAIAWRDTLHHLYLTRVNGDNGTSITESFPNTSTTLVRGLAANGTNLLLAIQGGTETQRTTRFLKLNPTNSAYFAECVVTNRPLWNQLQIFPEGEGWTGFDLTPDGLINYSIQPDGRRITVVSNIYPVVNFAANFNLRSAAIAPFGAGRFIVAAPVGFNVGYQIIDRAGASAVHLTLGPVSESMPLVGASGDGYLISWFETGTPRRAMALRLQKDGSRIDAEPFELGTVLAPEAIAFNGTDYVLANALSEQICQIAYVAAFGAPNVRVTQAELGSSLPVDLVKSGPSMWCARATTNGIQALLIGREGAEGTVFTLPAGRLVGNGDIFHITPDFQPGEVRRFAGMSDPPIFTFVGGRREAAAIDSDLFLVWQSGVQPGQIDFVHLRNSANVAQGILPINADLFYVSVAASANDFIVVAKLPGGITQLVRIDRFTDEVTSTSQAAPDYYRIAPALASAGNDYLMVTTNTREDSNYLQFQWITTSPLPRFSAEFTAGKIATRLSLTSGRTYRIESSRDLLEWQPESQSSGASVFEQFDNAGSGGMKFYRASLLPE